MYRPLRHGLLALTLLVPRLAYSDAFERARQAVPVDIGRADLSGFSMRGGAALSTGAPAAGSTLFQGRTDVGSPCSGFDFGTSMKEALDTIPELLEGLMESILSNMPMLVLCYTSPSLCDLAKHFQSLINALIQAKYAQCNQMQMAMAYSGLRLRGGQIAHCLEYESNAGTPINTAMQRCTAGLSRLRLPNGLEGGEMHLVQDTLTAGGASPEMKALAGKLLGEVHMQTNNGALRVRQTRPQGAMMAQYEAHRVNSQQTLRDAVDELQATGTVSPALLEALAVPGQPIPRAALDALVALRSDPARYETHIQKLSTNLSITRLTWECQELQEQLGGSAESTAHHTDEERRLIEQQLAAVERDLKAVIAKKSVIEQHMQPAYDALMQEYANVQSVATQHGLRAPQQQTRPMPYGRQNSMGYSQ